MACCRAKWIEIWYSWVEVEHVYNTFVIAVSKSISESFGALVTKWLITTVGHRAKRGEILDSVGVEVGVGGGFINRGIRCI